MYRCKLKLKAKFDSYSSCFSFKRWNQALSLNTVFRCVTVAGTVVERLLERLRQRLLERLLELLLELLLERLWERGHTRVNLHRPTLNVRWLVLLMNVGSISTLPAFNPTSSSTLSPAKPTMTGSVPSPMSTSISPSQ
jgi:hypothetical protein